MSKKTFYDVLQVSQYADPEIIRAAYKSLVQRYHPDKNPDNSEAEKHLKIINHAYEVLSDPVKRVGYDAGLAEMDEIQPDQAGDDTLTRENNSGGANASNPYAATEENNSCVARPWIRFWGRTIDYSVWSVLVGFAIAYANNNGFISNDTSLLLRNPFAYPILITFTWALAEPMVIPMFSTTLGKAILNIRLIHKSNQNISWDKWASEMDVGVLYQRSMSVWLKGMGMGIPLVSLATQLSSYRILKSQGETSWDRDFGFTVTHGKVGYVRGSLAIIIILFAMILNAVGNTYQKQQNSTVDISDVDLPSPQSATNIVDFSEIDPPVLPSPQSTTQPNLFAESADLMKRAEQGNADAQFLLGVGYSTGKGLPQDYAQAALWYRKAAEQGNGFAQNNLGYAYKKGEGVPKDYIQAYMWMNLAATRGISSEIRDVAVKNREDFAALMTLYQIEQAQALTQDWLKKHPQ
ncbi:MAG: DnaJ domain-containing protein [Sulfuriferula sp.]